MRVLEGGKKMHDKHREIDFAGRTLTDIATTWPYATSIFRRYKLDFCHDGTKLLRDAVVMRGLALADIERDLDSMVDHWGSQPVPLETSAFIDFIEGKFHAVHRHELPELVRLARRVEVVHRYNPAVPRGLADLLERMGRELESHMQKEEVILFPWLRSGGGPMVSRPIAAMMAEHEEQSADLRGLAVLTNNFQVPEDGCTTWRALYLGARKFTGDLMEHIHQENNVLFPRFAKHAE